MQHWCISLVIVAHVLQVMDAFRNAYIRGASKEQLNDAKKKILAAIKANTQAK